MNLAYTYSSPEENNDLQALHDDRARFNENHEIVAETIMDGMSDDGFPALTLYLERYSAFGMRLSGRLLSSQV
jgi:hypothetical protein